MCEVVILFFLIFLNIFLFYKTKNEALSENLRFLKVYIFVVLRYLSWPVSILNVHMFV